MKKGYLGKSCGIKKSMERLRRIDGMERYFNTEGLCNPEEHYMIRLDDRLQQIRKRFVDRGKYFVINRGRQYGKTTTLRALAKDLRKDYLVVSLDFQMMSTTSFEHEKNFVSAFTKYFVRAAGNGQDAVEAVETSALKELAALSADESFGLEELFHRMSKICQVSRKPVVMMIDEVDSAANNQIFLDFLSLLRGYYLERKTRPIFHSVILAGVYDIKNLKLKIRPEEEHKYNSPWNIAADFDVNMNFTVEEIQSMLQEYEGDYHTGMDVGEMAAEIFQYTSGYPYLVSAICKILDEKLPERGADLEALGIRNIWGKEGIAEAVKIILKSKVPLFESMVKQLDIFSDLRNMIQEILYQGKRIPYSPDMKAISIGLMFGFLTEKDNQVMVANRIFEMRLLNLFISEEAVESDAFQFGERERNQFILGGRLDMDLVLKKFTEYFTDIYGDNDERFVEAYGRKLFLLYLKPIINGKGNYYMEAQTRDARRTDVIVDYKGEQFIVELKIWHGNEYNERGEKQLAEYLDYYRKKKGYLVSFNFNRKKWVGMKENRVGDKVIVEAVV